MNIEGDSHWYSVRLVIQRLRAAGSIPELALRRCALGNDTLRFHWGQAVYWLWWPSLTKDLQTEPKKAICFGVVDRRRVRGS